ncbi:formate--tetrahydrofolate ligase [Vibrio lentus]|nr:formate--tetrahydrofolate ligase [Vibrio lentus]
MAKLSDFKPLYESGNELGKVDGSRRSQLRRNRKYFAITFSQKQQLCAEFNQHGYSRLSVCLAKTPLSISTEAQVKGAPTPV